MNPHSNRLSRIGLFVAFLMGLSLLLYPSVSNYINEMHSTKAISSVKESLSDISSEEYEAILKSAKEYNQNLKNRRGAYSLSDAERETYNELLDVSGDGAMGYLDIPCIEVSLPIYHGTAETTLQTAVGHLDWSSLPVGGSGTHCVLSGHRGLPSAKLFTNLDKVVEGDLFTLCILNEVFTYEVDQIRIVEPTDLSYLTFEEGKDYCTLVTCTPYGINTHRLLVRGHRIENVEAERVAKVTSEAIVVEPMVVAPVMAAPLLILLFFVICLEPDHSKGKRRKD